MMEAYTYREPQPDSLGVRGEGRGKGRKRGRGEKGRERDNDEQLGIQLFYFRSHVPINHHQKIVKSIQKCIYSPPLRWIPHSPHTMVLMGDRSFGMTAPKRRRFLSLSLSLSLFLLLSFPFPLLLSSMTE